MTRLKEEDNPALESSSECCCMCGDSGLSSELFLCTICHFRSQHRYCSNLYPRSGSYDFCNWCLASSNSQNSSNSSSSSKINEPNMIIAAAAAAAGDAKKTRKTDDDGDDDQDDRGGLIIKRQRSAVDLRSQQVNGSVKKQVSSEKPHRTRRRIITKGRLEEMIRLRRTRSEEISNNGVGGDKRIANYGFRNKVRRYKLLDEVSS